MAVEGSGVGGVHRRCAGVGMTSGDLDLAQSPQKLPAEVDAKAPVVRAHQLCPPLRLKASGQVSSGSVLPRISSREAISPARWSRRPAASGCRAVDDRWDSCCSPRPVRRSWRPCSYLPGRASSGPVRSVTVRVAATSLAASPPARPARLGAPSGASLIRRGCAPGGRRCSWHCPALGVPRRQGGCDSRRRLRQVLALLLQPATLEPAGGQFRLNRRRQAC